jgi:succinyl-diaminopimelate desuccinylase
VTAQPTTSEVDRVQAGVLDMAADLIRIPTRGGLDKSGHRTIVERLSEAMRGLGLQPTVLTDGESLGVAATLDFGPGPHYVLDAPLDTATLGDGDAWTFDPFAGDIVDGWLRGRGAADAKTTVSIFSYLAADLGPSDDLSGKLTVLFDLDEHTGGFGGIKAWLASQDRKPDGVMIGYPGPDKIVVGGRGVWRARITVHGQSAHSGSQHAGINAINRATWLADLLADELPCWLLQNDRDFGLPPKFTVTSISGGASGAYSVVPDVCTIEVDIRLTPSFTAERAQEQVTRIVSMLDSGRTAQSVRPTVVTPVGEPWPAFRLPADHELVQAIQHGARQAGLNPTPTVAGPSNIGCFLSQHGIPATAGFGVAYRGLHAADEAIDVSTIPAVYASYLGAVRRLLR